LVLGSYVVTNDVPARIPSTLVSKLLKCVAFVVVTSVPVKAVTVDGGVLLRLASGRVLEMVTLVLPVSVSEAVADGEAVDSLVPVADSVMVGVVVLEGDLFGRVMVLLLDRVPDFDDDVVGVGVGDAVSDGLDVIVALGDGDGLAEMVSDAVNDEDRWLGTNVGEPVRFWVAVTFGGGVGVFEIVGVGCEREVVRDGVGDGVIESDSDNVTE
jgi:hypothetical protein